MTLADVDMFAMSLPGVLAWPAASMLAHRRATLLLSMHRSPPSSCCESSPRPWSTISA
jgi:hypothetical protein